jgi:ApbE superfamily uncharacterized protein (UPF0280 family)
LTALRARLPDGRWHFQHGPIDIVIGADGDPRAVEAAHDAAWHRFETILAELVAELPALRRPVRAGDCPLEGVVARRMWRACFPYRDRHVTPMAAVAGSVAQELVAAYDRDGVERAFVNNGGDIALHLAPGASVRVGLCADLARHVPREGRAALPPDADFEVRADMPVRGIATSGWRGRSLSLGIADSVTVLATTASAADAAATMIANAVDVADARIVRAPAREVRDDSDLGDLPVTVDVPPLEAAIVERAVAAGLAQAREIERDGLIEGALIVCQGQSASLAGGTGRRHARPIAPPHAAPHVPNEPVRWA